MLRTCESDIEGHGTRTAGVTVVVRLETLFPVHLRDIIRANSQIVRSVVHAFFFYRRRTAGCMLFLVCPSKRGKSVFFKYCAILNILNLPAKRIKKRLWMQICKKMLLFLRDLGLTSSVKKYSRTNDPSFVGLFLVHPSTDGSSIYLRLLYTLLLMVTAFSPRLDRELPSRDRRDLQDRWF